MTASFLAVNFCRLNLFAFLSIDIIDLVVSMEAIKGSRRSKL